MIMSTSTVPTRLLFVALAMLLLPSTSSTACADDRSVLRVYDVRDILFKRRDFPAPKLGLPDFDSENGNAGGLVNLDAEEDENDSNITRDRLIELIKWVLGDDADVATIAIHNDRLFIAAPPAQHGKVASRLADIRFQASTKIATHFRFAQLDTATLERLGFGKHHSARKSHRLPRGVVDEVIATSLRAGTGTIITPRTKDSTDANAVSSGDGDRIVAVEHDNASWSKLDELAYVADVEIDESTQVADPVIEVVKQGTLLETRASRRGKRVALKWKVSVSEAAQPFELDDGGIVAISLPEVTTTTLDGRTVLGRDQVLVVYCKSGFRLGDQRANVMLLDASPVSGSAPK